MQDEYVELYDPLTGEFVTEGWLSELMEQYEWDEYTMVSSTPDIELERDAG